MVKYSVNNSIALIQIDRADQLNALSLDILNKLDDKFTKAINDNNVLVIILTGRGKKSFIAGADISEMKNMNSEQAINYSRVGQKLTQKIENSDKPVIAAVNGYALGGGCEFAMACHFRYASTNAKFGQPEVGLGLIPGFGGTQRLINLVGKGHASELLFSGKIIDSEEALRIGLINNIFDQGELIDACINIAEKIKMNSPIAIKYTITAQNNGEKMPLNDGLKLEAEYFKQVFQTKDSKEGISAFMEKRKPKFTGE